jgi:hypothetical protein
MTDLFCKNGRFVNVHNVFINPIVNINTLCKPCVKIAFFLSDLIFSLLYTDSDIQPGIEQSVSCTYLSFVQFSLIFGKHKQNSDKVKPGD